MKKIKIFRGFSLAEALITLLIVCLITLASIPVITKKKRTPDRGTRGLWMCALNSQGKYVVFDSNNPEGSADDPESWKESANATFCRFDPPVNAKNISVTLIGGGGAGGNGISELEPILDSLHPSFRPTENALYRLTMIGGGGGGAHGSNQSGLGGSGGAAGAFFVGNIRLPAFYEYGHVLGAGGAGGENIDASQSSEPWADSGGDTKFYINTSEGQKDFIIAHGGGGGQARTCKNRWGFWKCGGGNPSTGGRVEFKNIANFYYQTTGASYTGQGMPGTNTKTDTKNPTYTTAGTGTTILVNGVGQTFGGGGRGVYHARSNSTESGRVGYFSLDKFSLFGGLGGEAALPTEYTFPKINGHLKFTIGKGGTATAQRSTAGQPTELEYYNLKNQVIARYYGAGGSAGANNTDHVSTAGSNSYWTKIGGGAVGVCRDGQNASVTSDSQIAYVETGKCLVMLGTGGYRSATLNLDVQRSYADSNLDYPLFMNHAYSNYNHPELECNPIGLDVDSSKKGLDIPCVNNAKENKLTDNDQKKVNNGTRTIFVNSYQLVNGSFMRHYCNHMWYCSKDKAREALEDLYCESGSETSDKCINARQTTAISDLLCMFNMTDDSLIDEINGLDGDITTESEYSSNKSKVDGIVHQIKNNKQGKNGTHKYLTYWTENIDNKHGFTYECLLPEYKQVRVPYGVYNVETPPTCERSANGTSFGAGGGGGAVNENYVGSAGIGGEGASGAVIIKW